MPNEDQQDAFRVGWYRSRHSVNTATRLYARKFAAKGCLDEFLQGWLIQQLFCVMFEGNPNMWGMGLPPKFYPQIYLEGDS